MTGGTFRRILGAVVVVSALAGGAYGYLSGRANYVRLNEELASSYELRLNTVRDLVGHARAHAIEPQSGLGAAVERAAKRPNVTNRASFARFESEQGVIANAARELIATMDGELDPTDNTFAKLIRQFDSEEQALSRLHRRHRRGRLASFVITPE